MAWRQAEAIYQRSLKRISEGLQDEPLDEALDVGVQDNVEENFKKFYSWKAFQPEEIGADTLLGRVFREFQKWKPSMYAISKVKSVAITQHSTHSAKRHCGGGVTVTVDGEDDADGYSMAMFLSFLYALEVLCNTWALAGCFDTESKEYPGKFAHWADTTAYYKVIRDNGTKELTQYTEDSVIVYCREVEEEFRRRAISLTRSSEKIPWGAALAKVIKDNSNIWQNKRELLVRRVTLTAHVGDSGPRSKKGKGSGKDAAPKGTTAKDKATWATARKDASGNDICKMFNDVRGCKDWCPAKRAHVCDVVLASGKTCLSKSHARTGHNPAQHGNPSARKDIAVGDRR